MHDDMKFDEFLARVAKDYKSGIAPRANEIWAAIEPDVANAVRPSMRSRSIAALRSTPRLRTTTWIGIGIAATLMIGVAIGRFSSRTTTRSQLVVQHAPRVIDDSLSSAAHSRATTFEHLAEAEVFLTAVRADLKAGRSDAERTERSRELLVRTRLLLGNAARTSPEMSRLLEDLELLLAEISAMPAARSSMDKKLLDESMREGNVLPRIRATLPAQQAGT